MTKMIGFWRRPVHTAYANSKVFVGSFVDGIIAYRHYNPTKASRKRIVHLMKCGTYDIFRSGRYILIERKIT